MGISIGIDLGTTFSVVSYVKEDGSYEVIPNDYGNRTTPSVVLVDNDNNFLIGESALDSSQNFPEKNLIQTVKRKIGTDHIYIINDISYTPVQISSEILKYLKNTAENYTGKQIDNAVITVPAYFNNDQRLATKKAGELAGLNVSRIINEPTAASLAYGLDKNNDSTILVFDLGGGTFDVTLLKLSDGCDFHVLSTSGNTSLGGVDFDLNFAKYVYDKYLEENIELKNLKFENLIERDKRKLLEACEKTKKLLSLGNTGYVTIPYFVFYESKLHNLQIKVTRNDFERSIEDLINSLKYNIDQCLEDANLKFSDLNEIVFVGGSTRIPMVSSKIQEWTNIIPNKSINPDEAVSIGAAIQADVLSGNSKKEVYLLDVTPLSLGIETLGGFMNVMIKRNTTIPTEYTETFTTAYDNQSSVDVKVFQGERPQTYNNHFMGEFKLDNIPLTRKGVPKIEVLFSVDADGIVTVKANDESGNQKILVLSGDLSSDTIKRMITDAEENKMSDDLFKIINELRQSLTSYKIQMLELIDAKLLNDSEILNLNDMILSIDDDIESENLELLNSLTYAAKELIQNYSDKIYTKAKQVI